jgi:hypothetical protein
MKRLFFILLILILIAVSCKPTTKSQWTETYRDQIEDLSAVSLLPAPDGGFLLVGTESHYSEPEHGDVSRTFAMKTDARGKSMWEKEVNDFQRLRLTFTAFETADKGLIIFEATRVDEKYNVTATKTDENGNKLWHKIIEAEITALPLNICKNSGGGYFLSCARSSQDISVIEVNENGEVIARETLDFSIDNLGFTIIKCMANGDLIVTGEQRTGESSSNIYVMRLDNNGKKLWDRTIGDEGKVESPVDVVGTSDGSIVILGSTSSGTMPRADKNLLIISLGADGTQLWSNEWGSENLVESGNEIVQCQDGGFMIVGEKVIGLLGTVFIMKIDKQGNEIWSRTFENSENSWSVANAILEVAEGFLVAGNFGEIKPMTRQRIFLMQIDSEGNYVPLSEVNP